MNRVVLFGGAIGDTNKYSITRDTYILDMNTLVWRKPICTGVPPTPRAAHASVAIENSQVVVYGGAAGSNSIVKLRRKPCLGRTLRTKIKGWRGKCSMDNSSGGGKYSWKTLWS